MKLVDVTCKSCGAQLHIDGERKIAFCEYCGARLLIDDEVRHLQIDNAENIGYEFEKGRQRAQKEAGEQYYQTASDIPEPAPKKKNSKMVWWVLGWIFIFPIPLTVLMVRNKNLSKKARAAIIAAAWIVFILMVIIANITKSNEDSDTSAKTAGRTHYTTQIRL